MLLRLKRRADSFDNWATEVKRSLDPSDPKVGESVQICITCLVWPCHYEGFDRRSCNRTFQFMWPHAAALFFLRSDVNNSDLKIGVQVRDWPRVQLLNFKSVTFQEPVLFPVADKRRRL